MRTYPKKEKTDMLKVTIYIIIFIGLAVITGNLLKVYQHNHARSSLPYDTITGYELKEVTPLEEGVNYFVMESSRDFNIIFNVNTERGQFAPLITPRKNIAITIAVPNASIKSKIYFKSIEYGQDNIYVNYVFSPDGKEGIPVVPDQLQNVMEEDYSYLDAKDGKIPTKTAISTISISKPSEVLDLYIYENGKFKKRIALGRRVSGSPLSYRDFKRNYTGTFEGTTPCADCKGIQYELTLNSDNSFLLSKTYIGKSKIPEKEIGQWDISEDLAILELFPLKTYLFIVDKNTIEIMSPDTKRIISNSNYTLTKVKN